MGKLEHLNLVSSSVDKIGHKESAYMAVVRESETKQVRYADMRTIVLHPCIRSYLATNLLILCARIPFNSELPWYRTAHKDFLGRTTDLDLNWYANIKPTSNPRTLIQNETAVSATQPEVVHDKRFDSLFLLPKILVEVGGLSFVGQFVDDFVFVARGRVVCYWLAIMELESSGHMESILKLKLIIGRGAYCVNLG